MLTRLSVLAGGTIKMGRLSWVVDAIYRILQGCYGNDTIVLSIYTRVEAGAGREWLVDRSIEDCHN